MNTKPTYPSPEHDQVARAVVDFFSGQNVDAVILTCSCARGKASRDSCLDISILLSPEDFTIRRDALERQWVEFYESEEVFEHLRRVGKYSGVDLDFIDGCFQPQDWGWTGGPDSFELEIGNILAYSVPLLERTCYFQKLKERWLPYYSDQLRQERLAQARKHCLNNLDHIPLYVGRRLYFQAFQRLYHALQEFLQALFISRRTYPIAYDKWIQEQVEEILDMPELYRQFVSLLEITHFEGDEIVLKARQLEDLFHKHVLE
jgi:predicted nucleotidyltransferase